MSPPKPPVAVEAAEIKAQHKLLLRLRGFFDALRNREISDGESEDRGLRRDADDLATQVEAALEWEPFLPLRQRAASPRMSLQDARALVQGEAERTARRPPPAKASSVTVGGKRMSTASGTGKTLGTLADLGQRILHELDGTIDRKALAAALYLFQAEPGCDDFPRTWRGARKLLDVSSLGWGAAVRNDFVSDEGVGYELLPLGEAACVLLLASTGRLDSLISMTWADLLRCTASAE